MSLNEILDRKERIASQGMGFDICTPCNDLLRFMDDRTPDGRGLSEWIYELHAQAQTPADPYISPLFTWIYTMCAQEGQTHRLSKILTAQLQAHDQQLVRMRAQLQVLPNQLHDIEASRGWRFIKNVARLRRRVIPPGSRREFVFLWLLDRLRLG